MNNRFVLFCAILSFCDAFSKFDLLDWKAYKNEHGKHYENDADDEYHFRLFIQTRKEVIEHNERFEKGIESYTMGLNELSDMNFEDFLQQRSFIDESDE